jgi:predicted amidohydrolase YtcJ
MRPRAARLLVVVALTVPAAAASARSQVAPATLVFRGGPILTLEAKSPRAQALAVRGGRILAVGAERTVLQKAGRGARIVELRGRTLLPAFVDAHDHVFNDAEKRGLTLEQAQAMALANGISALGDTFVTPEFFARMTTFARLGKLRVRTSLYLIYDTNCGDVLGEWYAPQRPISDPTRMLRIPGVKIFADGGSCGRPAVSFDYPSGGRGDLFLSPDQLSHAVENAQRLGFQVAIHALGDRAFDAALDGIRNALRSAPNNPRWRHRIEHAAIVRDDQLARVRQVDPVLVLFGDFHACTFNAGGFGRADIPPSAASWLWRWRDLLHAAPKLHAAWHSDWPVFSINPLVNLYELATRRQLAEDGSVCRPEPEQANDAIPLQTALRMMTIGAAYALGQDSAIGSLRVGKLADLVVLSGNPLAVPFDRIPGIQVLATYVGGKAEFCAAGARRVC